MQKIRIIEQQVAKSSEVSIILCFTLTAHFHVILIYYLITLHGISKVGKLTRNMMGQTENYDKDTFEEK